MKILFVLECANLLNNGTTATCLRFAEQLRLRGHEVTILGCDYPEGKNPENYVGFQHYNFPIFEGLIHAEGFNFVHSEPAKMYGLIKEADIVHLFLPFKFSNVARLIAQSIGVPVTAAFHLQPQNVTQALGMDHFALPNNILYASFRNYIYNMVRRVHCPSKMIADELKRHHYDNCTTHIISNGITDFFHPMEVEKPEGIKDKFVVTMVGRLSKEKRQDLIIKAIARSRHNKDIQLVLCGQGPLERKYQKLARKEGLANPLITHFCSQEELRVILNYTDIYVHASDFEIEGIGCIEAFACGAVPIISNARLAATKDFALSEDCLFQHGSWKSLRDRIDHFFEHQEELPALSEAYVRESRDYALPIMVDKMEEMFALAIEDLKTGQDMPSLHPSKKDRKKARKIFAALLEKGIIEKMPDSLR